jgi:hypothetical protein
VRCARVDLFTVGQQLYRSAATGRVEQPGGEPVGEDVQDRVELMDRKSPLPQIGQDQQFEELNGRVPPLGVPAGGGAV